MANANMKELIRIPTECELNELRTIDNDIEFEIYSKQRNLMNKMSCINKRQRNEQVGNEQVGNEQIGGELTLKLTNFQLYLVVCGFFISSVLAIHNSLGFGNVHCFSWYSNFARFNRTASQNIYCDVLLSLNEQLATYLLPVLTARNITGLTTGIAGCILYYDRIKTVILKVHQQILQIVEYIATQNDAAAKAKANIAVIEIVGALDSALKTNSGDADAQARAEARAAAVEEIEAAEAAEENDQTGGKLRKKKPAAAPKKKPAVAPKKKPAVPKKKPDPKKKV